LYIEINLGLHWCHQGKHNLKGRKEKGEKGKRDRTKERKNDGRIRHEGGIRNEGKIRTK
jgi:hypothetical protein